MNTKLVKGLKTVGGLVVFTEVIDVLGKAQMLKAMYRKYPTEAGDLIGILDNAGNDGTKGYTELKCNMIGKIARFYIDCVE